MRREIKQAGVRTQELGQSSSIVSWHLLALIGSFLASCTSSGGFCGAEMTGPVAIAELVIWIGHRTRL